MKLDTKLIKYDMRIDVECNFIGILSSPSGWSSLFTVCSIFEGGEQEIISGIIFQHEDWADRKQSLRRGPPKVKHSEILIEHFLLYG